MNNTLKYSLILATSLALFGVGYYFYRKRTQFVPTKESANYDVVFEINE